MLPSPLAERFPDRLLLRSHLGISTWRAGERVLKVASTPIALEALRRQAQVLARLPKAEFEWLESEAALVLPFITGETLEQRLERGSVTHDELSKLACDLVGALAALHRAQLLHGDIKPSNIVLADPAVLIDFGLARSLLLTSQASGGTLAYLSPEQAGVVSHPIGASSDLFSLGVVLYQAAEGRHPFPGPDLRSWLHQLASHDPPPASMLGDILQTLLEKDPRDRYPDAATLLADLTLTPPRCSWKRGRLRSPALVGRKQELQQLLDAWKRAESALVVMGIEAPAGTGKSRLLEEFRAQLSQQGVDVWQGPGGAQYPWQSLTPIAEAAARRCAQDAEFARRLREKAMPYRAVLCQILPSLMPCFGQQPIPSTNASQHEISQALACFLTALGGVVVLEDQHWGARAIHELLLNLADSPETGLLLVCSYRGDELPQMSPLRQIPAIQLSPLPPEQIQQMLDSMAGTLPTGVVGAVERAARGNPFAASSILRGLVESRGLSLARNPMGTPAWVLQPTALENLSADQQSARILVTRLDLLPRDARLFIEAGAVLGRSFVTDQAARLADLSPDQARQATELASSRQLLMAGMDSSRFSHDLIREEVLARLPAAELQNLHRRASTLLDEEDFFGRSTHLHGAGQPDQALPFALQAAQMALTRQDPVLARQHLHIAERAWPVATPSERLRIRESLLDILVGQRDPALAMAEYEQAWAVAQERNDRIRLKRKRCEICLNLLQLDEHRRATYELFSLLTGSPLPRWKQALGLLRRLPLVFRLEHTLKNLDQLPAGPPQDEELGHLAFHLIQVSFRSEGNLLLMAFATFFGIEWAVSVRPSPVSCFFLTVAVTVFTLSGDPKRPARLLASLRPHILALNEYRWRTRALIASAQAYLVLGLMPEALRDFEASRQSLERSGERLDEAALNCEGSMALFYTGRLKELRRHQQVAWELAQERGDALGRLMARLMEALLTLGEVEEIADASEDRLRQAVALYISGLRLWRLGHFADARETFHRLIRSTPFFGFRHALAWAAECTRREAEGLPPGTGRERLLRRAKAEARRAVKAIPQWAPMGPHALREAALTAWLLGETQPASEQMQDSLRRSQQLGMPLEEALTRLALARVGGLAAQSQRQLGLRQLEDLGLRYPYEPAPEAPNLARMDRFETLLSAGRRLAGARQPELVWNLLREGAEELLRPQQVAVLRATGDPYSGPALPISQRLLAQALESGEVRIYDEEVSLNESLLLSGVRSTLLAPVISQGETLAVLALNHAGIPGYFREEESRIARYLCTHAGAAMENIISEAGLEAVFDGAGVELSLLDPEGNLLRCNRATPTVLLSSYRQRLLHEWRKLFADTNSIGFHLEAMAERGPAVTTVLVHGRRIGATQRGVLSVVDISPKRSRKLLRLQEMERHFLAAELHDGVSQDLAALSQEIQSRPSDPLADRSRKLVGSMSRLLGRLRNPQLDGENLMLALQGCVADHTVGLNQVQLQLDPALEKLRGPLAHAIYRLVQEALVNVSKHARASSVYVEVSVRKGYARGCVVDDGIGLKPQAQNRYGIRLMRARARLLGGACRIESLPDGGCEVRFRLPLDPHPGKPKPELPPGE